MELTRLVRLALPCGPSSTTERIRPPILPRPGSRPERAPHASALISVGDDAIVDPVYDELFLRVVLERALFVRQTPARRDGWDAIARAFAAAGGVGVHGRVDVTKRLGVLTTILLDQPHLLTPALRAMVLEFNERNCAAGFAQSLSGEFLGMLRVHAHAAAVGSPVATSATGDPLLHRRAVEDERLLQLVIQNRPWEFGKRPQLSVWMAICNAFNATVASVWTAIVDDLPSSGAIGGVENFQTRLVSGYVASQRVRAATTALLDREDPYHAYLTPALREMVVEVNLCTYDKPSSAKPPAPKPAKRPIPELESESESESDAPSDEATRPVVRGRAVHVFPSFDEQFMRLVLERAPCRQPVGRKTAAWNRVARAWRKQVNPNAPLQLPRGGTARTRVQYLEAVYLNPTHGEYCKMTPVLKGLLLEYSQMKMRPCVEKGEQKESSHNSVVTLSEHETAGQAVAPTHVSQSSSHISNLSRSASLSSPAQQASHQSSDCDRDARAKRQCLAPPDPDEDDDDTWSSDETTTDIDSHFALEVPTSPSPQPPEAVSPEPAADELLFNRSSPPTCRGDRSEHENAQPNMTTLHESLVKLTDVRTTHLLERVEFEQRQRQVERDTRRRETEALVEAIDRERKDRHDEFVAMVQLLSRSLPPQDQAVPFDEIGVQNDELQE